MRHVPRDLELGMRDHQKFQDRCSKTEKQPHDQCKPTLLFIQIFADRKYFDSALMEVKTSHALWFVETKKSPVEG